jgi:hypothetical protein
MKETTGDALERRVAASLAPALSLQLDPVRKNTNPVASWRRISIADGMELHVRDDSPAASDDTVVALRDALRRQLGL